MASNRFAALAPDFEEEEAKRKQAAEQKAKKEALRVKTEEKPHAERRPEGREMGQQRPRGTMERGRGRGMGRPYRGRGGYRGGAGAGAPSYVVKEKPGFHDDRDFHFTGSNDPVHPFDRKSGTGRGTEVAKAGAGKGGWGNPADDLKNIEKYPAEEETHAEAHEGEHVEEHKEGAEQKPEDAKRQAKREKKMRKKFGKKEEEEVVEETYDPNAMTLAEYQAKLAEKQTGLPTKKAEVPIARNPKTAAGLVAYEKKQLSNESAVAAKKKETKEKTEAEAAEAKPSVLGTFIGEEARGFRGARRGDGDHHRGRGRGYGRGAVEEHPKEEKKPERSAFVMKDEEFPSL
jgi:plasminogen activator inhibitor 1 RNA-binding protein